jgi:hypothetical protein
MKKWGFSIEKNDRPAPGGDPFNPTFREWVAPHLAVCAVWAVIIAGLWWIGFGTAYTFLVDPVHFGLGAFAAWVLFALFLPGNE